MNIKKRNVVIIINNGNDDEFIHNLSIFNDMCDWEVVVDTNTLHPYNIMGDFTVDRYIIHKGGLINARHIYQWMTSGQEFMSHSNIFCGRTKYSVEFHGWYNTYNDDITGNEFFDKHISNHILSNTLHPNDNVIVYTLFGKEDPRYVSSLYTLMTVNREVYPNYDVIIYIDDIIYNSNTYTTLLDIQDQGLLYIIRVDDIYNNDTLILTAYRMKEVWNIANNVVCIRDIDSIPNSFEVKSTIFFENSDYTLSTIRSNPVHWWYGHVLYLAGLSNFKPYLIRYLTDNVSFDKYLSDYEYVWDGDQRLLRKYFGNDVDRAYICTNFIDFVQEGVTTRYKDIDTMDVITIDRYIINNDLLRVLDNTTKWAGQPISDTTELTHFLYNDDYDINSI